MKGAFGNEGALRFLFPTPNDVFVVPAIDQRINLARVVSAKQDSPFDPFSSPMSSVSSFAGSSAARTALVMNVAMIARQQIGNRILFQTIIQAVK
jgi:hypothetical protein